MSLGSDDGFAKAFNHQMCAPFPALSRRERTGEGRDQGPEAVRTQIKRQP
jgi:hypothetical protein